MHVGPKKTIFKRFYQIFFQSHKIATEVINISSIPWHISLELEINQKNESGCGVRGQIWCSVKKQRKTSIVKQGKEEPLKNLG